MERFIIRKNTLPYVHQWAVIDTATGKKVGEYKTEKMAGNALIIFQCMDGKPIPRQVSGVTEGAIEAAQKRMQRPEGDQQPELPRYSNKRRVELD